MERRRVAIGGIVQGVGFRPFVYSLADSLNLSGFVRNHLEGVDIEVEGEVAALDRFLEKVETDHPSLARIERLTCETLDPRGDRTFQIESSDATGHASVFISPDVATCDDCLRELFDPADRRFHYAFLNCTQCGPRLTIVSDGPYDRSRTTMAGFTMCPACRSEYEAPADRRFHAQPNACPRCGPQLTLHEADGTLVRVTDPLAAFATDIQAGRIGAMKGLGGFHLVCDAANAEAVAALRQRKHRARKPFAIMVGDVRGAEMLCVLRDAEGDLLQSPRRPIVLLRTRGDAPVAADVAPGRHELGVMLPYTPLHHLLLRAVGDRPLVMTSGNQSDEPIAYDNDDALQRLASIADRFLMHDRSIHVRCDDSVTRLVRGAELPVRRSRGYAPQPVNLPMPIEAPTLAVGGQLKNTFALARDRYAFLSHHIGDLDDLKAYEAFTRDIGLYENLFAIEPTTLVHDLHPDYATTRYAKQRAADDDRLDLVPVQHHHAHMASVLAEHRLHEPAIGVIFDGTGYGTDGTVWGGEFLVGDCHTFHRHAHLRPVAMPGGEKAIREPWRMALAHLSDAGCQAGLLHGRIDSYARRTVTQMIDRQLNSPMTSSAGRLFDAVASLAGVCDEATYEGQAAIELQMLAETSDPAGAYPFDLTNDSAPALAHNHAPLTIDIRPMIEAIVADCEAPSPAARIARQFHTTLVHIISAVCDRLRAITGIDTVVTSGGVFMNALLLSETTETLENEGFAVFRNQQVPPNDGGLSYGQLAVAAARASEEKPERRRARRPVLHEPVS